MRRVVRACEERPAAAWRRCKSTCWRASTMAGARRCSALRPRPPMSRVTRLATEGVCRAASAASALMEPRWMGFCRSPSCLASSVLSSIRACSRTFCRSELPAGGVRV